ncbi:MAG: hypothetical protein V4487_09220 [Chlamydiota bacterium]
MFRKNSSLIFSYPEVYFGSFANRYDEIGEEWNFVTPWTISLEMDLSFSLQNKIGLFIHWPNES